MAHLQHEGTAEIRISSSAATNLFDLKNSDMYQLLPSQNLKHIPGLKGTALMEIELGIKPTLSNKPSTLQVEKVINVNNVQTEVRTFLKFDTRYNRWVAKVPIILPSSTAVPTPQMGAKLLRVVLTDAIFAANVNYHLDIVTKIMFDII